MMLSLTEQQLLPDVSQAQAGDLASFNRLIHRYRQTVTGIALAIVKDLDASEEVAQQVFIHVWQQLQTLREPASFLPWLRQITRYRAYNYLRDHKIKQKVSGAEAELLLEQFADPTANVADNLQRDEQNALIQQLIDQLPEDSREIVLLYYREEQSSQQVAALLGLSDANVRKKLSRVRELLKDQLLRRFGTVLLSTAPGIGFSSLLASLLVGTSPSAAAATAAAITSPSATGGASGSVLSKVAALLGGAMLGAMAGVLAVIWSMRQILSQTDDQQEQQALRRVRNLTIGWLLSCAMLMTLSYEFTAGAWGPLSSFGLLLLGLLYSMRRVTQITAPRLAKAAQDPKVARQQQRQKILCAVGTAAGFIAGLAGLMIGLSNSGRW